MQVRDLGAIRRRLAGMGLDWESAAIAAQRKEGPPRLRLKIDASGLQPVRPGESIELPAVVPDGMDAAELARWVERLGSLDGADAEKALAGAGPAALPILRQARDTAG